MTGSQVQFDTDVNARREHGLILAVEASALTLGGLAAWLAFRFVTHALPGGHLRGVAFLALFALVACGLSYLNSLVEQGRFGWVSRARQRSKRKDAQRFGDQRLKAAMEHLRLEQSVGTGTKCTLLGALRDAAVESGQPELAAACERAMESQRASFEHR